MRAGLALGSSQKLPRAEFQGLYKSCMVRRLRSIILTTSKPTVPEPKTHLPSLQSRGPQCPWLDFQDRERSPFTPCFLIFKLFKDLPFFFFLSPCFPHFNFFSFSIENVMVRWTRQKFARNFMICRERETGKVVQKSRSHRRGSLAGLGTVVELGVDV